MNDTVNETETRGKVIPLGTVSPSAFTVGLVRPGTAKWFAEQAPVMPLDVLQRHAVDFKNQLEAADRGNLPLTQNDRMEIGQALNVLNGRIDELLPIAPAGLEISDSFSLERVSDRWPIELPATTRQVHMHWRELIFAWRISPFRESHGSEQITVDEFAETSGISRFVFESKQDAGDFLDHFDLGDFVTARPTETGSVHSATGRPYFYIELTNKFPAENVKAFLEVYASAIMALTVIYDERRRAVSMDNGKFGYVTAHHFTARERIELDRIIFARQNLGTNFRQLTESARQ